MSETLKQQMVALEAQIVAGDASTREDLLPKLRAVVSKLEEQGILPPGSVRAHLTDAVDDALDDQFDNMPI